ncbi:MAG: CHAT domain-containing protein [Thermoanaerobaculia bacterium]
MPKESPVFELLIRPGKGRFVSRVLHSAVGTGAETRFAAPIKPSEEHALFGTLRGIGKASEAETARGVELARELGARLFRAALGGEVGTCYREALARRQPGPGLEIRLRLDPHPGLCSWPWELLYDPDEKEFLALGSVTHLVRCPDLRGEFPKSEPPARLSILVVAAAPEESPCLDTARELERAQQALAPLVQGRLARVEVLERATRSGLARALGKQRMQVLHFIGHSSAGSSSAAPVLLLCGEGGKADRLEAGQLMAMLKRARQVGGEDTGLQLVILNSCDSCREPENQLLSGLAQSLLSKGVPSVIGMQAPVTDESASRFAGGFYSGLAQGLSVEHAMQEARRELFTSGRPDWFTPVLFQRSEPTQERWWPSLAKRVKRLVFRRRRWLLGLATAAGTGAGIWLWSQQPPPPPVLPSSDVRCPSPPGLEWNFVYVEGGTFQMGRLRSDSEAPHRVEIAHPFCLSATETTQAVWYQVMGTTKPDPERLYRPATHVSWEKAHEFLARLNATDPTHPYRLLTGEEWEYAAQDPRLLEGEAESSAVLAKLANCQGSDQTERVASRLANPRGLYDQLGNVAEWVEDPAPSSKPDQPMRQRRGGSARNKGTCGPWTITLSNPSSEDWLGGFRVARDPLW